MTYLLLFWEFFKAGLFAVGGGLAIIPFLYDLADRYTWFDRRMLADMIAVSESTPGPIGINMATFAGFHAAGIFGGIIATVGIAAPSVIIILLVAKALAKFKDSKIVAYIFSGLRPAVCALIATAGIEILKISVFTPQKFAESGLWYNFFDLKSVILFAALLFLTNKFNRHPIFYLAIGAACGIIFSF